MSGNSQGSYRVTDENQMKAYDKLPPSARKALQDSLFNWACPPIVTYWRKGRKGFKTGPEIAEQIAKWDCKKSKRRGE